MMANTASPDVFLLAHSHGIALLDSISKWRERFVADSGEKDTRFGAPLQDWFNGAISAEPFETDVTDARLSFKRLQAWMISGGAGISELAQLHHDQGRNTLHIHEKLTETLQAWNGSAPIVSMLNGNEHSKMMLNRYPAYDFIEPEVPGLLADAQVIDTAFVDEPISEWIRDVLPTLMAVRRSTRNPLIHVLPPPPREHPENSSTFEVLPKSVAAYGFLPRSA
jgi:hypothetical protein